MQITTFRSIFQYSKNAEKALTAFRTTQNLGDLVRRYVRDADLPPRFSPHSLRHTCATHLLKGGADIRHIQRLLRHDSLTSTEVYTHLVIDDLKEAQARFHPRERMDA